VQNYIGHSFVLLKNTVVQSFADKYQHAGTGESAQVLTGKQKIQNIFTALLSTVGQESLWRQASYKRHHHMFAKQKRHQQCSYSQHWKHLKPTHHRCGRQLIIVERAATTNAWPGQYKKGKYDQNGADISGPF
jgi:hypothetical protein